MTKTTDVRIMSTNESHLKTFANTLKPISSPLEEKTISASSSSTQEICTDKYPKNSSTEEQQDTSRTNESNNTQTSIPKRTKNIILNTEDTNMTDNTTSNKETA
ncbi:1553_t:CDS:2 [Scutellospora calospora]|uniref:1553_t:CDS:1 n=1 Tax=Scutellospora calospora TaxID=85575 RepID=A0ACA9L3L8_9GLOM|nr:1553_t:CDS:2 [Scutellospora calospora]